MTTLHSVKHSMVIWNTWLINRIQTQVRKQQRESSGMKQNLLLCQNTRNGVRRISNCSWSLPPTLTPTVLIAFKLMQIKQAKNHALQCCIFWLQEQRCCLNQEMYNASWFYSKLYHHFARIAMTTRSLACGWNLHPWFMFLVENSMGEIHFPVQDMDEICPLAGTNYDFPW